jgi:hypothetical protein
MQQGIHVVVQLTTRMVLFLLCTVAAQAQTQRAADTTTPGQIVDVICSADTTQTYALYLPSNYTPAKRWPIVYFFDPGGRGRRPVELYRELAESYGFIFAGSNNSRNFSGDQSKAVGAIWQDTHLRLSLDDRRVYVSGFSGGARVAGAMALNGSGQIAGVIAHGAGYPNVRHGASDKLLYYFAVGNQDFNWPEVITVGHERETQGLAFRVRVYPGTHQWAPASVMEDALQWLNLKAMKNGDLTPDSAFIDRQFQELQKEVDDAEKRKDALAQYKAYRAMVSDFVGLRDVSAASAKLAFLKQSPALKAALKDEQDQIAEQLSIEREISPKLHAYESESVPDPNALGREIVQAMVALKQQASHAKSEDHRLVLRRALGDMTVEGIENGQQELQEGHLDKAESCFDLMKRVSDDAWPVLLLAETRAAMGNKKQAIKDLQEAVHRGLRDADVLESDKQFQVLRAEPEFQKLITDLKAK